VRLTALLDANVLYPATTRSVLMYLAIGGVFQARWTAAIQDEWTRSLLDNKPDLKPERIARTRELMDSRIPDRVNLLNPPVSVDGYLAALDQNELTRTAEALRVVAGEL
jgi:hypothetical protein